MSKPLDQRLADQRTRPSPQRVVGVPGTAIWGGFVENNEKNSKLASTHERQRTYSEILANVSIVAAGTRFFLNLAAKSGWLFRPSEADTGGEFAERAEKALTEDPDTPWHRIVRRATMHRFYGFSVQEWTAKRSDEGWLTFADVAPRGQQTIEQWDVQDDGRVMGVIQRSPQTAEELYLPRDKVLYLVDDTLSDSPEGLGIFRHIVRPSEKLARYEQLEGFGYETDLRGVPIGRAPFSELQQAVSDGIISEAQRQQIEAPLRSFIINHIKTPNLGLMLDSITYEGKDEVGRASNQKQWDLELLKGNSEGTQFSDVANAIDRLNREIARILGVEQLMLGSDGAGSFALSRDKTNSFFLLIDGALLEVVEAVRRDLIGALWRLNGWPDDMKPTVTTEAVRHTDVSEVASTLSDMARAGAMLGPDDPVISDVRDLLGVNRPPEDLSTDMAADAALTGAEEQEPIEPTEENE